MTRVSVNSKSFISFRENRRKKRFPFTVETLYYVLVLLFAVHSIVVQSTLSILVAAFAKVCYTEKTTTTMAAAMVVASVCVLSLRGGSGV